MSIRQLSPYELNQLRKYGLSDLDLASIGQKPIEYLTGHAEFLGLDFLVNSHVLIPRLESEQVVTTATSFLESLPPNHLNIADLGTGSGCLGISIAYSLLKHSIASFDLWLSDVSDSALKTAEDNTRRLLPNRSDKIHFLKSDLLANYPPLQKFDVLVANLPYIPSARIPSLDPSVKDYEPLIALDGGPEGTTLINRLLSSAQNHLQPNFQIILEIDSKQNLDQFTLPPNSQAEIKKDIFKRPRFLIVSPS